MTKNRKKGSIKDDDVKSFDLEGVRETTNQGSGIQNKFQEIDEDQEIF